MKMLIQAPILAMLLLVCLLAMLSGTAKADPLATDAQGSLRVPLSSQATETRRLQDSQSYLYTVALKFQFFDGFEPTGDERIREVQDLVRRTQIFYRQVFAWQFSVSYLDSSTTFDDGTIAVTGGGDDPLVLSFKVTVTGTFRFQGNVPNEQEAFDAVQNFEGDDYLNIVVYQTIPNDIFGNVETVFIDHVQLFPTDMPTDTPTRKPTPSPTRRPTQNPTRAPTRRPTPAPTRRPTPAPTRRPTPAPTRRPTPAPTRRPTPAPTRRPTGRPTRRPTPSPTNSPSMASPTTGAPTDGSCPTIIGQEGNVIFGFFFADRPPNEAEEQEMARGTFEFFKDTLEAAFLGTFVSYTGEVDSTEFMLDPPTQYRLGIIAQVGFAPCAPSLEDFQAVLDGADYDKLWQEYVRPDAGSGPNNMLVFLESASYSGTIEYLDGTGPNPTPSPTRAPTRRPTPAPTRRPTPAPTRRPTPAPTRRPTPAPTRTPTRRPTPSPTRVPTNPPPTAPPTSGFAFQTVFDSNYPIEFQTLSVQALTMLERVITGDLSDQTRQDEITTDCGDDPTNIDDTFVCFIWGGDFPSDSGLAFAGPTFLRYDPSADDYLLPITGQVNVNPNSAPDLPDGEFVTLILHEALHVMGIGTLWDEFELVTTPDTLTCEYRADTIAGARFQEISGCPATMAVPMEKDPDDDDPNEGVCGHWDQTCFGGTETMTPILGDQPEGAEQVFSPVSIGSLEDMGYTVNYSAGGTLTDANFSEECMCTSRGTAGTAFVAKPPLSEAGRREAKAAGQVHLATEKAKYEARGGDAAVPSGVKFIGHKVVSVVYKEGDYTYGVIVRADDEKPDKASPAFASFSVDILSKLSEGGN